MGRPGGPLAGRRSECDGLAVGIEAAATFIQLLLVFTRGPAQRRGLSRVRALAPDLAADAYPALWIYFADPVAGSAAAAAAILAWGRRPVTGKLRHDPAIDCQMRCGLPHQTAVAARTEAALDSRAGGVIHGIPRHHDHSRPGRDI